MLDDEETLLTVTDLKQWLYCPRVAYYMRCLPGVRPVTYRMQAAREAHDDEEDRERRRSLRTYGLDEGERAYNVPLVSRRLGLRGKIDLVIRRSDEVIPVEYKDAAGRAGEHVAIQLAAYGLLLEEMTGLTARRGFLYFIPLRRSRPVILSDNLKESVRSAVAALRTMVAREAMPEPTPHRRRCGVCEFRRFCNDVV